MYLSRITIRNFRQFGAPGVAVDFQPGISVLAGPNDSGKTAVVDAIRYVLTTKDQDYIGIQSDDYHVNLDGVVAPEIILTCEFDGLSATDNATFLEYLTPNADGSFSLAIQWRATPKSVGSRKWTQTTVSAGLNGEGPVLDSTARHLLACAYLRPLRDAEREMSPGKGSRLSKVLNSFPGVKTGESFDIENVPKADSEVGVLSLSGLHEYLRHLVNKHEGIEAAASSLNDDYLSQISLAHDNLAAEINFSNGSTDSERLRRILERLELNFIDGLSRPAVGRYGLGSNNLLYMACELLLVSKEGGLPLLLVEEPEAHLHPQRQLQLMQFLEERTKATGSLQVIVSTHSPVLASKAKVANVVLIHSGQAFSLAKGKTKLSNSDYGFLDRFLDATKSNLFFAQGVIVVEGDAEELLLPTLARLAGGDLTKQGVSIVNVGSTALKRYTKIFQRKQIADTINGVPLLGIPVASIADRDIMPDIAPEILGLVSGEEDERWENNRRKWRIESDRKFLADSEIEGSDREKIAASKEKVLDKLREADGQLVTTFPANYWTLEYDLALGGLSKQVFCAAMLAKADERISKAKIPDEELQKVLNAASKKWESDHLDFSGEEHAVRIYKLFVGGNGVSKAVAAQYLAGMLEDEFQGRAEDFRNLLPPYILEAIQHVSRSGDVSDA